MRGYIYIIKHGEDNRFKVGKTSQNPLERRDQLDSTGVPEPLKVIASFPVENIDISEKKVHQALEKYRNRREWFHNISEEQIIQIVKDKCETKFESDNSEYSNLNNHQKEIFNALLISNNVSFEKICELAESNSWSPYINAAHPKYIYKKLFYIFTYNKKLPPSLLNENLNFLGEEKNKKFHEDFITSLANINLKTFINNTSNLFKKNPSMPFNLLFLGAALNEIRYVSEAKKALLFSSWKNQIELFSNNKVELVDRELKHYSSLEKLIEFIKNFCRGYRIR